MYQQCLGERQAKLGSDHLDTQPTANNLAVLYKTEGRSAEAEPLYLECLRVRRSRLGPDHPDTLRIISNLAALYKSEERFEEAEQLYQVSGLIII